MRVMTLDSGESALADRTSGECCLSLLADLCGGAAVWVSPEGLRLRLTLLQGDLGWGLLSLTRGLLCRQSVGETTGNTHFGDRFHSEPTPTIRTSTPTPEGPSSKPAGTQVTSAPTPHLLPTLWSAPKAPGPSQPSPSPHLPLAWCSLARQDSALSPPLSLEGGCLALLLLSLGRPLPWWLLQKAPPELCPDPFCLESLASSGLRPLVTAERRGH